MVKRPLDTHYNAIPIRIEGTQFRECATCGESLLSPQEANEISRKAKVLARKRLGLLEPEAIVAIRRRLGLGQQEIEQLFGLGEKVVTRWERGIVLQTQTADILLRLLADNPKILEPLKQVAEEKSKAKMAP